MSYSQTILSLLPPPRRRRARPVESREGDVQPLYTGLGSPTNSVDYADETSLYLTCTREQKEYSLSLSLSLESGATIPTV
jgi:hypothetical protein